LALFVPFRFTEEISLKTLAVSRLLALAACLSGALPLAADSLTGKVVDPQGAIVPNTQVSLFDRASGGRSKTTTSAAGEYSFRDIAAGTYLLEAGTPGAGMSSSQEVAVSGSANKGVTLTVTASMVRVLVTATGTPVSEQEVASTVDIVDVAQINARDEVFLAEALRTIPGVQIQTQVGGVFQIRTRGLSNQYTAFLIDGMRFRDATAERADASPFTSDFTVTDLGGIEFMRGSGSSLYGTNAIGGVVNIMSNEGGGRIHGAGRIEGGGLGMYRATLNLAGGVAQDRLSYSGGVSRLDVTKGVRGNTPNSNNSGQLFAKYKFTPRLSLSGRVWGSGAFQRAVESPAFTSAITANFPPAPAFVNVVPLADSQLALYEAGQPFNAGKATLIPGVADPDGKTSTHFAATSFVLLDQLTDNTSWRASYQLVNTKRAYTDGPAGTGFEPSSPEVSDFVGRTQQLQLRFDSRSSFNQITGGYEFETEFLDSIASRAVTGNPPQIRSTGSQRSHSFYGQDQIRLFQNRLQVVFGGRIQLFDLKDPSFTGATNPYVTAKIESPDNAYTGDISAAYFAKSNTKFRAHVGNGYRAPSLYERFGSFYDSFFGFSFIGDPRLSSEKSVAFDGGIDQWFLNEKVRASATFYYTNLSQTIVFANSISADPFQRFFGYANSLSGGRSGGISRGVELSTQLAPTRKTSVTMSYTFNNADQRSPTIGTAFFQATNTAHHIFSLTATQWITRRLNATVDFYGMSNTFQSPFGAGGRILAFPSPKRTDLVLNYNLPINDQRSMDLYFKVENLFNLRYTDNGFLAPQAVALAGLKLNF
jgi:iron complex outermembrane receptor protein